MQNKSMFIDKKRVLFFVHYNKYNDLSEHVVYLLKHINKIYTKIVLISNSTLSSNDLGRLDGLYSTFIQRDNIGFDFGAWKDALLQEGWDALAEYDSVTLMNDTCFGPIFDFEDVYYTMQAKAVDFWGLVNHREVKNISIDDYIQEHIQSYFFCFNTNVVAAPCFKEFWVNVQNEVEVELVIKKYETRLTQYLVDNGFCYAVFFDTSLRLEHGDNFSHLHPDVVIANKVPLIKIKSFFENEIHSNSEVKEILRNVSEYPLSIINKYFSENCSPDEVINISSKALNCEINKDIAKQCSNFALAVCVKLKNIARFKEISMLLPSLSNKVDLYISVELPEQKNELIAFFTNKKLKNYSPRIIVEDCLLGPLWDPRFFVNKKKYDVVGFFHENSFFSSEMSSDVFSTIKPPLLLEKAHEILHEFYKNDRLGIVIGDIPKGYKFDKLEGGGRACKQAMQDIWAELQCNNRINFLEKSFFVFPYAKMFWCRPDALKPLLNLKSDCSTLQSKYKFSSEDLRRCMERLFVYVAWSEHYDFRVLVNHHFNFTGYNHYLLREKICCRNSRMSALLRNRFRNKLSQQSDSC